MKLFHILAFLAILFFNLNDIIGQNEVIEGIVIDKQTNKPLPFVSVVYNTSNQGFITNIDGKFTIKDISKIEFLKFSYVGYQAKILNKDFLVRNEPITVHLVEETYDLSEVIIYPGENPAHRIIKKVLENRKINDPEELSDYSYTSYNKMYLTIDMENIKKLMNDSLHIADSMQVDTSLQKAKAFFENQHLMLMESITERNYQKPGKINEKVLASKVSGFKEPSFVLLATQMQSLSFYTEMITLLESRYVNPISTGSTNRYFFNIQDTTYTSGGDTIFSILFRPKRNRNFEGLKGILNINTNKYAIQSVVAEPVERNGIIDLKITQNYEMVDGEHWFPIELITDLVMDKFIGVKADDKQLKIIGRGKTYLSKIKINSNPDEIKFRVIELEVKNEAFKQNDSIWTKFRHDALTKQESKTYHVLDSIGKKENLDFKLKVIKSITNGYIPFYFVNINVSGILDFNVFEGFRPGLGFLTNEKISKFFSVGLFTAYGFKDKQWKYGGNIIFNLSTSKQFQLGLSYKKDVEESGGYRFFEDQFISNSSEAYRDFFIADMTYLDEYKANFSFRVLKKFRINLYGRQFEMKSTNSYSFYTNGDFSPVNSTYGLHEVGFQLKYAPNESLAYMADELFSLNPHNSPVVYFNAIRGIKNASNGFDYLKLEAKLDVNFMTKALGRTSIQLCGAKSFGNSPYFMLYNGHESYYDFAVETANSFATMRMNEFLSDEFISLHYRQDFGGLLFKSEKFRPKIIFCNSVGFGRLGKPDLHQGIEFKTMEKGYYESGLIINNIIRLVKFIGYGFGVYYRYGPYSFSNISNNFAYKLTLTFEL